MRKFLKKSNKAIDNNAVRGINQGSKNRFYTGKMAIVITIIAVAMSLFHLYAASFGTILAIRQRAIHLFFILTLIFLIYPSNKKSYNRKIPTPIDFILVVLSAITTLFLVYDLDTYALRGSTITSFEYLMGIILIVLVLEAARRSIGYELPVLSLIFLLYGYFGKYAPGILAHRGFPVKMIVEQMYLTDIGLFGIALGVSASFIFLFILFGAFLGETGMAAFFNDVSMGLAGHKPGGPAKVSILTSGLMGTVSGSAVANVATTGAFTIPLMKSIGYQPYFAGAVEAVASTGGQIMPPIMGAAAFIIAEFLGISYGKVMIAAIIPALLYYLCVWLIVDLRAKRIGLKGLPKGELPNVKYVIKTRGHLIIPLIVITYLLVTGYTPTYAATMSIVVAIATSYLRPETRLSFRGLIKALEVGARNGITVGIACAVVGFIVGIAGLTGLGLTLADNIIMIAKGKLFLTLLLSMIASIILGMGLPTTACYIVAATIAAPAITKLGVEPLAAHLFVFYFAILANVTPPVALAAYTGAGIASAEPSKVGWTAFRMALAGFIIPYVIVYSPILLFINVTIPQLLVSIITAIIGIWGISVFSEGYLLKDTSIFERIIVAIGAIFLLKVGFKTDILGLLCLAIVYIMQKKYLKKEVSI